MIRSDKLNRLLAGVFFWWLLAWILVCSVLLPTNRLSAAPTSAVVVGFVGGFIRHDDAIHQEVQIASRLRNDYHAGLEVKVFENHAGAQARQQILRMLDSDHNGALSAGEKLKARIIIYGHSWGASEAINLARTLGKDGVPVLLTIQVDSVSKLGEDDKLIPANVAQAINFYQLDRLLHGRRMIIATDPLRTRILGNFQSRYDARPVNCAGYPWYARIFMKPHIEIENDPSVWNRVESLIRSALAS
jgi:hypothetical protein